MHPFEQLLGDALNPSVRLAPGRLAGLTPDQWREWLALADAQRVRPLLWHRLRQKGVAHLLPDETATSLKEALHRNAMRNLRRYGELRNLLAALQAEDIPVILLKGIYLAEAVYGNVGLREMCDIDLLARPGDLKRIAGILAEMGYRSPRHVCPDITVQTDHHLPPLIKPGYATFEIHWNLSRPDGYAAADPEILWARAVPVRIAGCDTLALSPVDLILHLCYHTSYHHRFVFGLRPSLDIGAVVDRFGPAIDWQGLAELAGRLGWQRGVFMALRLARDLVGADIPDALLKGLCPADMPEAIIAVARTQIFSDKEAARPITSHLAALLGTDGLVGKCRIFCRRLFLPRVQMAAHYPVPVDSLRIYACYLHRFIDLLFRYRHHLNRYRHDDDGRLHLLVERQNCIADWLTGATGNR